MAEQRQVMCINKAHRFSPHERIERIGGVEGGPHTVLTAALAPRWSMTEDEAIAAIQGGSLQFYTLVNGQRAEVVVHRHGLLGREYLTTRPDDIKQDNLLFLPECPRP